MIRLVSCIRRRRCLIVFFGIAALLVPSSVAQTTIPIHKLFRLTIIDVDGKPLDGVQVEFRGVSDVQPENLTSGKFLNQMGSRFRVATNSAGHLAFDLGEVPVDRLSIRIRQPGFGPYFASWNQLEGQTIPLEFTAQLEKAWSIGGNRFGRIAACGATEIAVFGITG
ncbi:MAG: hypothetical protein AAF802_25525 [Planctomycetota bacterium]